MHCYPILVTTVGQVLVLGVTNVHLSMVLFVSVWTRSPKWSDVLLARHIRVGKCVDHGKY